LISNAHHSHTHALHTHTDIIAMLSGRCRTQVGAAHSETHWLYGFCFFFRFCFLMISIGVQAHQKAQPKKKMKKSYKKYHNKKKKKSKKNGPYHKRLRSCGASRFSIQLFFFLLMIDVFLKHSFTIKKWKML
jgi:hypothetical protein